MRISDWSSDVCSSDLHEHDGQADLLDYAGEIRGSVPCRADPEKQQIGVPIDAIHIKARRHAMLALRSLDRAIPPRRRPSTQRSLQEAFDRKLSELLRQIRLERRWRSEEHTSELQSLMRISYAVFCLKKKTQ